ncbi:MAG: arylesterase [Steroidobacteraceae bacterium]
MGDSISAAYGIAAEQGWVSLLQARLRTQGYGYRVVNASVSGETTEGGRNRLPRALQRHRPAIVIIELGGNDGLRGLPLDTTRANLAQMIKLSRRAGARVVLLGMRLPPNYGEEYGNAFAALYAELAQSPDVELVPFFLDGVALEPGMMQPDGLHPGAAAQATLLQNAWPKLKILLSKAKAK